MPLPSDKAALHARVEAKLAAFLAVLDTRQTAYLSVKGRYWQGLQNPPAVPAVEDAGARMDAGLRVPAREIVGVSRPALESWGDMNFGAALPDGAGFSLAVQSLVTPDGPGYAVIARLRLDGDEYVRVIRRGPEPLDADWRKIKRRR